LAPPAFGGAIGALFGKTPHGVFFGFAFEAFLLLVGMIMLVVLGPLID
jgi:hypothetical protein